MLKIFKNLCYSPISGIQRSVLSCLLTEFWKKSSLKCKKSILLSVHDILTFRSTLKILKIIRFFKTLLNRKEKRRHLSKVKFSLATNFWNYVFRSNLHFQHSSWLVNLVVRSIWWENRLRRTCQAKCWKHISNMKM